MWTKFKEHFIISGFLNKYPDGMVIINPVPDMDIEDRDQPIYVFKNDVQVLQTTQGEAPVKAAGLHAAEILVISHTGTSYVLFNTFKNICCFDYHFIVIHDVHR